MKTYEIERNYDDNDKPDGWNLIVVYPSGRREWCQWYPTKHSATVGKRWCEKNAK